MKHRREQDNYNLNKPMDTRRRKMLITAAVIGGISAIILVVSIAFMLTGAGTVCVGACQ